MATSAGGLPYVETSDLVSGYPAVSELLAETLDTQLAAKLDIASVVPSKILQVVTNTYSTQVSSTSSSWVAVDLTATITPTLNTSTIWIVVHTAGGTLGSTGSVFYTVFRGTTAGTNLGATNEGLVGLYTAASQNTCGIAINVKDSPATASAQLYTLAMRSTAVSTTGYAQNNNSKAVMTLLEVAA
jgi:hypothetical protein